MYDVGIKPAGLVPSKVLPLKSKSQILDMEVQELEFALLDSGLHWSSISSLCLPLFLLKVNVQSAPFCWKYTICLWISEGYNEEIALSLRGDVGLGTILSL